MPKTKPTTITGKAPSKASKPTSAATAKNRKIKIAKRRWWHLRRRGPKPVLSKIPSSWFLFKQSLRSMWKHKWLFLRIVLVFALLNIILVRGFSGSGTTSELKSSVIDVTQGNFGKLAGAVSIFAYITLSSNNKASEAAGAYQVILVIVGSLAVIWTLRQLSAGEKVRLKMRDAYYRGMTPLVPFICETLLTIMCLLPFTIGATVYATVIKYGIITGWWEHALYFSVMAALTVLSLRIFIAPFMGMYIVTLPDMTPLKALRSGKQLVRFRRWNVLRKALFFACMCLLLSALIIVPVVFIYAAAAPWVFFGLVMISLVLFHHYFYGLYRELINHAP
ncbi:MAG: conserved rane protein of unknown function [Candidatus Saccharibacteria bacterium]|nr:conserved rane protein of unknown function [Candidatus Saccharibacteria bacterium]